MSSFQYTSMNTLAYADVPLDQTSMTSTLTSTAHQLSMSFGVAAVFFIPHHLHAEAPEIIRGIHRACLTLGALAAASTLVFRTLESNDGATISQHNIAMAGQANEARLLSSTTD